MVTEILSRLTRDLGVNREKPRVGLSACLAGEAVRYDGTDKRHALIMDELSACLSFQTLCPEVAIGLGVPRPTIQVIRRQQGLRIEGVNNPMLDVTEALSNLGQQTLADLDGFIFKARSPSCGVGNTPIMDAHGQVVAYGDGGFSASFQQRWPHVPVISEASFDRLDQLDAFLTAVYAHQQQRIRDSLLKGGNAPQRPVDS